MKLFIGLSLCEVAGNITVQLNCDLFESQDEAVEVATRAAREEYPDGQVIGSGGTQVDDETVLKAAALLRPPPSAPTPFPTAPPRRRAGSPMAAPTGMAADMLAACARLSVFGRTDAAR